MLWVLTLLPDTFIIWFVNILLLLGVIGIVVSFFVKFIPVVNTYRVPLQIISVIVLMCGIYFKGGIDTEQKWRDRVAEAEAKIAEAEAKSKEVNTVIKKVYVDKIKIVTDTKIVVQEKIIEKEKIIDAECKVAPEAIDILNEAAKNPGENK
jgi:uncharacterized membrane protein YeiB